MKTKLMSVLLSLTLALSMIPLGSVMASATEQTYSISVSATGNGTVTVDPTEAAENTEVTVTMRADNGWFIKEMCVSDGEINYSRITYSSLTFEEDTDSFIMPANNVTVSVVFVQSGDDPGDDPGENPYGPGDSCPVTFDANGGEGELPQQELDYGSTYILPDCPFTKTDRVFYKWRVNGVEYDAGDEITVTGAVAIKAIWQHTQAVQEDYSTDQSVTTVKAVLKLTDSQTGEVNEVTVKEETTDSAFTQPYNEMVAYLIDDAKNELNFAANGYKDVKNAEIKVSDPSVTDTEDNRTYTTYDNQNFYDENGDHYTSITEIEGTYSHSWQYIVTLEAEYTYVPMSYIHVLSTRDGGWVDFWSEDYYGDYTQPYAITEGSEVTLSASPAPGYVFKGWYKGDVNASSYDEMFTDELITTQNPYVFNASGYPYICAKFEYTGVQRQGDQIQVWITDGGKASVQYTPTWNDAAYIKPKDGNQYVAIGEVVAFWKGDEITVNAKPDDGYSFKGWYHVNIEWEPGNNDKYEGEPIALTPSFTYKPGETVVDGDSEALRYICAVFEKTDASAVLLGDTDNNGRINVKDVTAIQRHIAELNLLSGDTLKAADINGDGSVTMADVTALQRFLAEFSGISYAIGQPLAA